MLEPPTRLSVTDFRKLPEVEHMMERINGDVIVPMDVIFGDDNVLQPDVF